MRILYRQSILWFAVALALLSCGRASAARWPDERTFGPFVCHADFSLAEYGGLFREMAQLQADIGRTLQLGESRETIHLFIFARKATYTGYIQQYFPSVPHRRALFIKQRGHGMVFAYVNEEFAVDIRHETTHALLHTVLPNLPLWLDEGLAEYFEVAADKRAFNNSHLPALQRDLRGGNVAAIDSLEEINDLKDMGADEYRYAWAWVHFMLHGPAEARDELIRYLVDMQAGVSTGDLSRRLRHRLPDLDRHFVQHFIQWRQ